MATNLATANPGHLTSQHVLTARRIFEEIKDSHGSELVAIYTPPGKLFIKYNGIGFLLF
jgi:hypothetical protein